MSETTFVSLALPTTGLAVVNTVVNDTTHVPLEHLQGRVGGNPTPITLAQGRITLWLDEDATSKGLEPNFSATMIASAFGFDQGTPLLGPVLFTGAFDTDGHDNGLEMEELSLLINLTDQCHAALAPLGVL